ncbi:MAG: xylulokinase, partial [Pseudomonadota bacterium]
LWCDTSTGEQCERIMEAFGGKQACIDELGNAILPGYTASKVRWFRDQHPGLYAKMRSILLPHDYLNFYLTGERCMEAGDASGTGFLDVHTRRWSSKMLAAVDPDRDLAECLPEVAVANAPIGTLLPAIAQELGLPAGVPVSLGGGDNMMSAIGTGNVEAGVVTMSLGTSGTVFAYSPTPVVDPKGNIAAFCSSTGGWLPLLCTMNCTVSTKLMSELIGSDPRNLDDLLDSSSPGASGVVTVPYFNGERTPNLPNAKGCVTGLDARNCRPENLVRSAVEGATFALRFGLEELAVQGVSAEQIVLTGGGANSPAWRQMVADICAAPVTMVNHSEGAAFGAALQALAMLEGPDTHIGELIATHLEWNDQARREPNASAVNFYNDTYREYQHAAQRVAELYG